MPEIVVGYNSWERYNLSLTFPCDFLSKVDFKGFIRKVHGKDKGEDEQLKPTNSSPA